MVLGRSTKALSVTLITLLALSMNMHAHAYKHTCTSTHTHTLTHTHKVYVSLSHTQMTYTVHSLTLQWWDGHVNLVYTVRKKEAKGGQPWRDNALQDVCSDEEEGDRLGKYDRGNFSRAIVVPTRIIL